jgi:hypothetical protein
MATSVGEKEPSTRSDANSKSENRSIYRGKKEHSSKSIEHSSKSTEHSSKSTDHSSKSTEHSSKSTAIRALIIFCYIHCGISWQFLFCIFYFFHVFSNLATLSPSNIMNIVIIITISSVGLKQLPAKDYEVATEITNPDAILVRSARMHELEIGDNPHRAMPFQSNQTIVGCLF